MVLLLPAASIGRDMSIGEASQKMQGNSWRLIFIYLLAFAPPFLLEFLLGAILSGLGMNSAVNNLRVSWLPWLLFTPIIVGVLSIAYRELVQTAEG